MQIGAAQPFQAYGPNYFNLPPTGSTEHHMYPSMDPSAMGTRVPGPGQSQKRRPDEDTRIEDASMKRARHDEMRPPMPSGPLPPQPGGFIPMGPPPSRFGMQPMPPPGPRPPMGELYVPTALPAILVSSSML